MQIVSLKLNNIKSYPDAVISFTQGTNAIVGQNGAGKSTVLEAIGFVLFDSLGYRQRDFVREGTKTGQATVTFVSSIDERLYDVTRRCGSSTQYFVYDPELEQKLYEGKTDVQAFLRQHMGVESSTNLEKLFSDAVGVPQGTFTAAFLEGKTERKNKFDALLHVREYEEAWSKLREPAALLRTRQQEMDVQIAGMSARLEQLPDLEVSLARRRQEIADGEAELTTTAAELATTLTEREALDAIQRKVARLKDAHARLDAQATANEQRLTTAKASLEEAKDAATVVAENQPGSAAYLAAQAQQKTLDKEVGERQALRDRKNAVDKTLALATAEKEAFVKALDEIVAAENAISELQSEVEQQAALEAQRSEIEQQVARLRTAGQEIDRLAKELRRQEERQATLAEQLSAADQLEAERAKTDSAIVEQSTAIQDDREELAGLRISSDKVKEQNVQLETIDTPLCPVCEQPLTDSHRAELMARNSEQLAEMRAAFRRLQKQIEEETGRLGATQKSLRSLEEQLRKLPRQSELDEMAQTVETLRSEIETLKSEVRGLSDAPALLQAIQAQLKALGNPRQQMAVAQASANRRASVEAGLAQIEKRVAVSLQELAEIESTLTAFVDLDGRLRAVARDREAHESAHQAVLTHRRLADSVGGREQDVEEAKQALAEVAAQLEQAGEQLKEATGQFNEDRFRALLAQEQNLVAKQAGLETQLKMQREAQSVDEKRVVDLRKVQADLSNLQAQRANLAEEERVLEDLRSVIRRAGPFITRALVQQVGEEAARIFGEIMQDHTRVLTWDEEYRVGLIVDGNERQFSQLSGGEQMSAAIAVRLALLRHMSNIDLAFFDEPTTNLDSERRDALAQQILSVHDLNQLFVISHDDTFEQATENLIRVERVNGMSRVLESV
jgi:exonuclease SbcC